MVERLDRNGLQVDARLVAFVEGQALPGSGIGADAFWSGLAATLADLAPKNRALLERRSVLQAQIDGWHIAHRGRALSPEEIARSAEMTRQGYGQRSFSASQCSPTTSASRMRMSSKA